ncbi:PAS domain S-box protein [uncultured Desulfuromusa sp.]|uniref:PAS domain S-box protein n=1 Tax=uncultured Desulfuromusa sp. TaxID=219183 RepID=UPI002AA75BD6|nr:PAS domain S-box protein [uncultured Desulfuromusa sp.]
MKVKWKIISLVMMIVIAACATFISLIVAQDRRNLHEEIAREVKNIKSIAALLEENKYQTYKLRILNFVNDTAESRKGLLRAFANRDRKDLLAKSKPFLQFLQNENPYFSTLAWITKDNKNFLRVHRPNLKIADDISEMRPDIVAANRTHSQVSGFKIAKSGLQYRVVQPVNYEGQHIGAVQFGIDTMLLQDSIYEKLKMPVASVIANDKTEYIVNTKVQSWSGPTHTLYSKQLDIFQNNDLPINWSLEVQRISYEGRSYQLIRAFDFLNHVNESEGRLFIALETTQREQQLSGQLALMSLISGVVLLVSFLILHSSYSNLLETIEALIDRLQVQNTDLEATVQQRTASLKQSEQRFKNLSALTFEGIILHQQGVALDVNESLLKICGYSRNELIGQNLIELCIPEEEHETVRANIAVDQAAPYEVMVRKKDGTIIPVEIQSRNVENEGKQYRVTAVRDISQRKQVERKYELLVQGTSLGIVLADAETGLIVECNDALIKMVNRERNDLIGRPQSTLHPPQKLTGGLTRAFIKNRDKIPKHATRDQLITKEGRIVETEVRANKIEYNGREMMLDLFQDITEKLLLEEQLRQKYKMEAIGVMAGGIAHNFNNSLAIILGSLEMAQRKFDEPEKAITFIENAQIAALRSRDLVSQIMVYSRKGISEKDKLTLTTVVDEIQKLISPTLPTTINLNISISPKASEQRVHADPSRIQEALLNLCNNAVQAMDEKGDLTITLEEVTLQQQDIPVQHQNCRPGTYIMLSVKDTGCGMDQDILSRIFDPFFTTKDVGKGTGMGLASVQGIIDQHDGLIKVHSSPGQGSTFKLYFPALEPSLSAPETDQKHYLQTGTESILLVDDDQMIINLSKQMLSDLGYHVVTATSGADALHIITENPQRFDLMITDQTMPGMTGQELTQKVRELNPDMPIILSTGYSSKVAKEDIKKHGFSAYCPKPLRLGELSQAIRRLLDK